jgi:hypothetical protein
MTPTVTPTKAPISPTATRIPGTPGAYTDTPGLYSQYDYPCPVALITGTLPSGEKLSMCPNGTDSYGVYQNMNAFRTDGGMDWVKLRTYSPDPLLKDAVALGGIYQTWWAWLNPAPGEYNWKLIDDYVAASAKLQMDTPNGLAPKGVVIKISNSISQMPAGGAPVVGIDGGFNFDDLTPGWVKEQMIGALPFKVNKLSGGTVAQDNGSYWIRTECVYTDYQRQHTQGSNWNYALWVIPKYDNPVWQGAAHTFMQALSEHYAGSNITFLIGLNGIDGEYGNWMQQAYAGCENLRAIAYSQYPTLRAKGGTVRDLPQWIGPNIHAFLGVTSDVDWTLITPYNLGISQARIVPDSPNYVYADQGVLQIPMQFSTTKDIAWENAYSWGNTADLYKEFSVAAMTFPKWFDIMGGLYWSDKANLREFMNQMGRDIVTSPELWIKAYDTCYRVGANCPNVPYAKSAWMGWPRNLEAGLVADSLNEYVKPWADLTPEQQKGTWASMLRKGKELTLRVDSRWKGNGQPVEVQVRYLDVGTADIHITNAFNEVVITRTNSGTYKDVRMPIGVGLGVIKITSTEPYIWHSVSLWRVP